MFEEVSRLYGNRVRVRVCGLCWQDDRLLLINHTGVSASDFWAPPGGGVEFGSALSHELQREFLEETGLLVECGGFLFGCEYVHPPLHAIELFFDVRMTGGSLKVGSDPEHQIISAAEFLSPKQISAIPPKARHGIFERAVSREELEKLSGFYSI